jgi:glycosyltransferase involved in cell wall biosynthesis
MNILLVTPFFTPQTGGVATYLEDLRRFLGQRGHHVVILRPGESDTIVRCPLNCDDKIYEFYMRGPWFSEAPLRGILATGLYFIPTLFRLARFLRQHRIDLICAEYPLPYMMYLILLRRWSRIKLLVGLHGDDVLSLQLLSRLDQAVVRALVRGSNWVLAHSSSLLEQAEQVFGHVKAKGSYLPYGVECERIRERALAARRREILQERPYVLTVAKLYERKGLDILLEAVSRIKHQLEGHRFLIVGDGPEESKLKHLAAGLGLDQHVTLFGEVSSREIPVLFQHCEFFVLPSRSEPFGIVLLEAMTLGKAIVATRVGGIPEFIKDGDTGLLVESGNSQALSEGILRLLRDHELRARLGKKGLQSVETRYDYHKLILRYEELFQSICSRTG